MLRTRGILLAAAAVLGSAAALLSQQQPETPTLRATVQEVLCPTTVTDKDGRIINGLRVQDFRLYDNDKLQAIKQDIGFLPLSMVVAIQVNNDTEHALARVKKMGPLLTNLIAGQNGEIAIISFDHRITKLQDFTNDGDKLNAALEKLRPGSSSSRLNDATNEAYYMLRNKKDRRKVILLVAETRDLASSSKVREVATNLQMWNIDVYTLNISNIIAKLTKKPEWSRPDPVPTAARTLPGAATKDPTTVAQFTGAPGYGGEMVPLFEEIFRGVYGLFTKNPAEAYTKMTGGKEFSFITQQDMERAIMRIGETLHSQYLLSYSPNNKLEGGFHKIHVEVLRPGLKVSTRPGYWMAGVPD